MEENKSIGREGETVFVGVDLHRFKWHVTVRTEDQEVFIVGLCRGTGRLSDTYWIGIGKIPFRLCMRRAILAFGFMIERWLMGPECIVTPPSLVPHEYGNRVKTDGGI